MGKYYYLVFKNITGIFKVLKACLDVSVVASVLDGWPSLCGHRPATQYHLGTWDTGEFLGSLQTKETENSGDGAQRDVLASLPDSYFGGSFKVRAIGIVVSLHTAQGLWSNLAIELSRFSHQISKFFYSANNFFLCEKHSVENLSPTSPWPRASHSGQGPVPNTIQLPNSVTPDSLRQTQLCWAFSGPTPLPFKIFTLSLVVLEICYMPPCNL